MWRVLSLSSTIRMSTPRPTSCTLTEQSGCLLLMKLPKCYEADETREAGKTPEADRISGEVFETREAVETPEAFEAREALETLGEASIPSGSLDRTQGKADRMSGEAVDTKETSVSNLRHLYRSVPLGEDPQPDTGNGWAQEHRVQLCSRPEPHPRDISRWQYSAAEEGQPESSSWYRQDCCR